MSITNIGDGHPKSCNMRDRFFIFIFALTSILMSLSIPVCARQSQGTEPAELKVLPDSLIDKIRSYDMSSEERAGLFRKSVLSEYVIEIGDIPEETMARPKGKEGYTRNIYKVPVGITVKELIFSLPGIKRNELGRLITQKEKITVSYINFNSQPVLPDDSRHRYYTDNTKLIIAPWSSDLCSQRYKDDTKLISGTVFVQIRKRTDGVNGAEIIIEYFQNVSYDMVGGNTEYVDLGLSVKWASRNVDASGPEEIGGFYFWGETETKDGYESSYKFRDGQGGFSKYNATDGKTVLDPEDDVAHVKLGGSWRLPTTHEINELIDNCTWTWASVNGDIGFLITSNKRGYKDRSIFLPYYYGGTSGDVAYWSGSFDAGPNGGAASLWIDYDGYIRSGYCYRHWQLPVRPVHP